MKFYYGFECYLSTGSEYVLCAGAGHAQGYKGLRGQADAVHRQGADLRAPSGLASAGKATQPHNSRAMSHASPTPRWRTKGAKGYEDVDRLHCASVPHRFAFFATRC